METSKNLSKIDVIFDISYFNSDTKHLKIKTTYDTKDLYPQNIKWFNSLNLIREWTYKNFDFVIEGSFNDEVLKYLYLNI